MADGSTNANVRPRVQRPLVVVLTGSRGVGKSTVAQELARSQDVRLVPMSERLELCCEEHFGRELAACTPGERDWARRKVDELCIDALNTAVNKITIFDTHLVDFRESRHEFLHTAPWLGGIDLVVLLEAPASMIVERRRSDAGRQRELDLESVEVETATERWAAREIANRHAARISVVEATGLPADVAAAVGTAIHTHNSDRMP